MDTARIARWLDFAKGALFMLMAPDDPKSGCFYIVTAPGRLILPGIASPGSIYMVLYSVFKTGLEGEILPHDNLRGAARYLPDNIYDALDLFNKAEWTTKLFGEDVKSRYADLKKAAADRCPRVLGTFVKVPEVQYHHEVYNQFLWNMF